MTAPPRKRPVIVVFGSIIMDLTALAETMPQAGQTVVGELFYTLPGGKGANQAVAAARLGADVRMVGRVGGDAFGAALLDGLRSEGIDVGGVAVDPDNASGVAMILLDARRENRIVAVYGANAACDETQLRAVERALDGADALLLQLETPPALTLEAAAAARARGVRVVWDPAPAQIAPPGIHAAADVLTPNQTEASMLAGVEVEDADSALAAAARLRAMGAPVALVKLGEQGVCYAYASANESGHVPAFAVDVVDTVAAGDAFARGASVRTVVVAAEGMYATRGGALWRCRGGARRHRNDIPSPSPLPGAQAAMPGRADVQRLLAEAKP